MLLEDADEEFLDVALRLDEVLERELERTLGIVRDPLCDWELRDALDRDDELFERTLGRARDPLCDRELPDTLGREDELFERTLSL
ncbi:MAG: hypothetical protein P8Z37_01130 [Acidobacteriota bacterium]